LNGTRTVSASEVEDGFPLHVSDGLMIGVQHQIHPADRIKITVIGLTPRHPFIVKSPFDFMPGLERCSLL
jgi:hypothetical protein